MPGLDADELFVAGTGKVLIAPVGTAAPADEDTAFAAGWIDLGYVTPEGVKMNVEWDREDIDAWQSPDPLRTLWTARRITFTFALRQWNENNIPLAFGGGAVVDNPAATHKKYEFPATIGPNPKALAIEAVDGLEVARIITPRADLNDNVEVTFARTQNSDLALSMRVLASSGVAPAYILGDPSVLVGG